MARIARGLKQHLLLFTYAFVLVSVFHLALQRSSANLRERSPKGDCFVNEDGTESTEDILAGAAIGVVGLDSVVYHHLPLPPKFEDVKFAKKYSLLIPTTYQTEILGLPSGLPIRRQFDQRNATEIDLKALASLVEITTKKTFECRKLLKQGGRTCQRIPDGDKKFCLEKSVAPSSRSCIVYSFGIGHDFSFDKAMGMFGCEVFAFDDDFYHDIYQRNPYKRVHFIHIRLGERVLYENEVNLVKNRSHEYLYRPLDNIMYLLHHEDSNIDILKLDVEGKEWDIFENSIFKTDILERTRQLSIEVHMEIFNEREVSSSQLNESVHRYLRFFHELQSRGFKLAHHEPNYIGDRIVATVGGVTFTILAEQVWVNLRLKEGRPPRYRRPIDYYIDLLEE